MKRLLVMMAVVVLAACASARADQVGNPTGGTLAGVGVLPGELGGTSSTPLGATSTLAPQTTTVISTPIQTAGPLALGNRVIVIGDSILASTAKRYTNDMCEALVPLGWQVEVDAESGRFVRFGAQVLSERMAAGWDVGVIMLGNNYDLDQASYLKQMTALVDRFDTRPVVLLTVSEFESSRAKVNDAIRSIAVSHSNVLVAEWADVTRDAPQLLGGDRLHLTNDGRAALAQLVAATLSTAPAQPGKCLSTNYEDDSAGSVNGDPDSSSTTTTKKQSSATSVPRTTVPRSTIPRTTIPKATTTSPSTTDPSTTDPSTTDPPGTGAP